MAIFGNSRKFCYSRHYEFEGDSGLESLGIFFLVVLHILKNICAKFQLVIIFGWVSVRIDRTTSHNSLVYNPELHLKVQITERLKKLATELFMEGGCIWKGITYVTATGFKFTETLDIASVSSMEFLDIQTSKKRM